MDPITLLISSLVGILSSLTLGAVKKVTSIGDTVVGKWLKPFQPIVIGILTVLFFAAGHVFHISNLPSAQVAAATPVSTVLAIVAREIYDHWFANSVPKNPPVPLTSTASK